LSNTLFTLSNNYHGLDSAPENLMTARIEINVVVLKGRLSFEVSYNKNAHYGTTVQWLIDSYLKNLEDIFRHIDQQEEFHFSSSDFELADLKAKDLDFMFSN
jgi:non-ribosomal peptide synthase protein (TIGR01720 family)